MSDVWAGIAGEFLHLYPASGRLVAVAGPDADRSAAVADELAGALRAAGQTVERAHTADGDEQRLRDGVIAGFRADVRTDRVLIVSGPANLLSKSARGLWNFTLWHLVGDEPPQTAASALVDVTDPAHPVRVWADFCAVPTGYGS